MPTTMRMLERSLMWAGTAAGLTTAMAGALPWFHVGAMPIGGFSDGAGWVFAICGMATTALYRGTVRGGTAAATGCAAAALGWGAWEYVLCRASRGIEPGGGLLLLACAGAVGVGSGVGLLLIRARRGGGVDGGEQNGETASLETTAQASVDSATQAPP